MSFLDRIRENNLWNPAGFRWFVVDGCRVGRVRHGLVPRLAAFGDTFIVESDAVHLNPRFTTFAARSAALDAVLKTLADEGIVKGRRAEYYPVTRSFAEPPFLQIERAGVPYFGTLSFGLHLNGFVRRPDGIHMWIGRRSRNKFSYPGMLDNTVAGGQPIGISLRDNLLKECQEEANIPKELAAKAVAVGCITYNHEVPEGFNPAVQFLYDLELPADFTPVNTDGELEEFYLWPIARVAKIVEETHEFKFNCNLVIIDFMIRHGLLAPDHPDYVAVGQGLRSPIVYS